MLATQSIIIKDAPLKNGAFTDCMPGYTRLKLIAIFILVLQSKFLTGYCLINSRVVSLPLSLILTE